MSIRKEGQILCQLGFIFIFIFCLILRLDHLLQKSGSPHLQQQDTNEQMTFNSSAKNHSPPTSLPARSAPCCSATPLGQPARFSLSLQHFHLDVGWSQFWISILSASQDQKVYLLRWHLLNEKDQWNLSVIRLTVVGVITQGLQHRSNGRHLRNNILTIFCSNLPAW